MMMLGPDDTAAWIRQWKDVNAPMEGYLGLSPNGDPQAVIVAPLPCGILADQ